MSAIFNVLTEFRFDIAHAVAGSKTLQGEVGKISSAADEAHYAIQRIGAGLVAQTGIGTGGIIGGLYAAVKAADKFEATQRQIANILLTNKLFTGPEAFKNAMAEAAESMDHMNKVATQFSLPSADLVQFSKLVGATLVAHGLDNSRLDKSVNLARGFLKSAPTLGIDPGLAQGQLLDAVMGRANMGDTLFQRISNETSAMKPFQGTAGAKAFNALEPAKRLDVLTRSLTQFGDVTEIVEANASSLSSQLQRFKDNITGIFSILRPIGKAIMDPLRKLLFTLNKYLEHEGKKIGETIGRVLTDVLKNPEKLFAQIQQLRNLKSDVKLAGNILAVTGLLHGLSAALKFFGVSLGGGLIATALRGIASAFRWLWALIPAGSVLAFVFRALSFIATKVIAPLVLLTTILQGISRGIAMAKIADMKFIAANMPKFLAFFEDMKVQLEAIMAPITLAIEGIGEIVAWMLSFGAVSQMVVDNMGLIARVFELFGRIIVGVLSLVAGLMNAIMGMVFDLSQGKFLDAFKNLVPNFQEGMLDLYHRFYKPGGLDVSNQATAQTKIEIDKVEINNAFKENAEPDRIAFTMKEQLMKAALNPTQAGGRSLSGAAVGN